MAKRESRKGKALRHVADLFTISGRNARWNDSVKRLQHEAAAADKSAGKRKRAQMRHLHSIAPR